jgi:hypothetical protein
MSVGAHKLNTNCVLADVQELCRCDRLIILYSDSVEQQVVLPLFGTFLFLIG